MQTSPSPPLPPRRLPDWLRAYGEFIADNEAPEVFHLWIAIGTLAGAAQRKIFMRGKHFDVHSNLYIILVSPPGKGKKTTALRIGKSILKLIEPKVNFATEAGSMSGVVETFDKIANSEHQSLTLYSSELGSLFADDPHRMTGFLTDIYDGNPDWQRQTVAHNLQQIARPWLNLMAGTTPSWLGDNLPNNAVEGGFVARCIFPFSDQRKLTSPFPEMTPEADAIHRDLVHDLSRIAQISGEFGFESEARAYYSKWYLDPARFPRVTDPRTATYYDRKHIHVLKVAMALSLSYKDELVLTAADLRTALQLLEDTEPGMIRAFGSVGKNEFATDTERILGQILSAGRVPYAQLIAANFHNVNKRKLDDILVELSYSGRITYEAQTKTWASVGASPNGNGAPSSV